jgi:hypothetical protein
VTSLRTTASAEPYADLNLKAWIDEGKIPGPKIYVSSPYMEGKGNFRLQVHELTGPEDARKTTEFWSDQGVTSKKQFLPRLASTPIGQRCDALYLHASLQSKYMRARAEDRAPARRLRSGIYSRRSHEAALLRFVEVPVDQGLAQRSAASLSISEQRFAFSANAALTWRCVQRERSSGRL